MNTTARIAHSVSAVWPGLPLAPTVASPSTATGPGNDRRRGRHRHTLCTAVLVFLTALPAAAQYDPPAGYYATAEGLTGPALKAALHDIIDGHTIVATNDLFMALRTLDEDPSNSGNVLTVYSGTSEPKFDSPSLTWNREHCWPQSYGISATGNEASADEADLFNLRACLSAVNNTRGSRFYDQARTNHPTDPAVAPSGAPQCLYDPNSGQGGLWTPRPSEKGDLARAMFYMAVRYDGSDAGTVDLELGDSPNASLAVFGNLKTLLQWHLDDPVSTEERRRNDLVYDRYQKNRNPFVDRPEFVAKIFGAPELQLAMDRSAYEEGTSAVATVSLPAPAPTPLNIRIIATGDGSEVSAPAVVTVPGGQASAQFTVNFLADGSADGDQQVGLAAWAEGYKSTFFALAVLDANGGSSTPPAAITGAGRYAQNFDTLPSAGTNNWSNNMTLPGWIAQRTGTGTNIVADSGSSTAGNLYSYGSAGSGERALGFLGSSSAGNFAHGVNLQNTSGRTIALASLSFAGEQWRNSAAAAQAVGFFYRKGSNAVTDLTPTNNTGWTSVSALNFTSPITGGSASSLNGNLAVNRTVLQSNLDIALAPGEWIALRWQDPDHPGSDHGLAIDDLRLDWRVAAEGPLPQWTSAAPPAGRVGDVYAYTLAANSGPSHYEVEGLPAGLQINAATGLISGTPAAAGSFNATAYAVNAAGAERATLSFVIAKGIPSIITPPVASVLAPGQPLSAATLTGGAASVPGNFAFSSPATVPSSGVSQQNVVFTPSDSVNYDTVTFGITVRADYGSGFEGASKSGYPAGAVTVDGIQWTFDDALVGADVNDLKNGAKSARLRNGSITMNSDLAGGIGEVRFVYGRSNFAGDRSGNAVVFAVEYSTDQGVSWQQAGSQVSLAGVDALAALSVPVNVSSAARVRIRKVSGDSGKRWNIDDLIITAYTAPAGMTFAQWSGGLNPTPDLVRLYGVGGATNAQSSGEAPGHGFDGATLSIEALVRTNDPALRVFGQSSTDLTSAVWTNSNVSATDIAKKPGDPADTARRVFSTPQGTNGSKFLRLRVELGP